MGHILKNQNLPPTLAKRCEMVMDFNFLKNLSHFMYHLQNDWG